MVVLVEKQGCLACSLVIAIQGLLDQSLPHGALGSCLCLQRCVAHQIHLPLLGSLCSPNGMHAHRKSIDNTRTAIDEHREHPSSDSLAIFAQNQRQGEASEHTARLRWAIGNKTPLLLYLSERQAQASLDLGVFCFCTFTSHNRQPVNEGRFQWFRTWRGPSRRVASKLLRFRAFLGARFARHGDLSSTNGPF